MKIEGMGNIPKREIAKIFTQEGRAAINDGDISWEEAGEMYKLEMVKKSSRIGACGDTFSRNYDRIPDGLKTKLSPEEIAELVDAFYNCYGDGKNAAED